MKAERQYKEATSRVIQSSKEGRGCITDNRDQTVSQAKIIDCIRLKQSAISLPIQCVRLSTHRILRNSLATEEGNVAHHIIPDSFVVDAINQNQLNLDEYEQFYDDVSNGIKLTKRNHNKLHHHYDYDAMVNEAVGDVGLSDISDENKPAINDIIDNLRTQIDVLFPHPTDDDDDYIDEDYSDDDYSDDYSEDDD